MKIKIHNLLCKKDASWKILDTKTSALSDHENEVFIFENTFARI